MLKRMSVSIERKWRRAKRRMFRWSSVLIETGHDTGYYLCVFWLWDKLMDQKYRNRVIVQDWIEFDHSFRTFSDFLTETPTRCSFIIEWFGWHIFAIIFPNSNFSLFRLHFSLHFFCSDLVPEGWLIVITAFSLITLNLWSSALVFRNREWERGWFDWGSL